MSFYKMGIDEGTKKKFAYGIGIDNKLWDEINCPICKRTWKKDIMLNEENDYSIVLSNSYYPDFLSYGTLTLISEKALESFKDEALTGYHIGNINVVSSEDVSDDKKSQLHKAGYKVNNFASKPIVYYRLLVDGKAELHEKSEIVLVESCDICGFFKYRPLKKPITLEDHFPKFIIKDGSWDESDFFRVKEYDAVIFCTEKLVHIYEKNKLTGLIFNKVIVTK